VRGDATGGGAAGKSAPLVFGALAEGTAIPVAMAPPGGFCELPAMHQARAQPLVAPAGDGALVVGGLGPDGPLSSAEYYDPETAAFVEVAVPGALSNGQGFTGAALATLPDGRVALVGGPQHAVVVFDPRARAFVTDPTLVDARAFHAAIATGADEILVAGGCSGVAAGACSEPAEAELVAQRYQLSRLRQPEPAATLASGLRIAPRLFDLGIQLDGARRYVLAGGSGAIGRADRFAVGDPTAEVLAGGRAQPAALDGGAVLTAFAADAAAADGAAAVIVPGAAAAVPVASAPALSGARLVALENGSVVGFGGDPAGRVLRYDPLQDGWTLSRAESPDQTGALRAPSLARLSDGTVLVLGGAVSPRAWLYRPSLVGPASGSITATPVGGTAVGILTAPDPSTVTRDGGQWRLTTPSGAAMASALVGGPRTATGSVRAIVRVLAGGVALIARQTGPGQAVIAELLPGDAPRLVRRDAGGAHEVCRASAVLAAFDPAVPVTVRLVLTDHDARLAIDDREVLACGLPAGERGAWGLASLGASAEVAVESVTVAR